jgi:hypothetical protein
MNELFSSKFQVPALGHPESTLNRVKDKIERQNSHVGIYREQNAVMNHAPRARVGSLH